MELLNRAVRAEFAMLDADDESRWGITNLHFVIPRLVQEEIPEKLEELTKMPHQIFGVGGAVIEAHRGATLREARMEVPRGRR